jgi:hypothetical protein
MRSLSRWAARFSRVSNDANSTSPPARRTSSAGELYRVVASQGVTLRARGLFDDRRLVAGVDPGAWRQPRR